MQRTKLERITTLLIAAECSAVQSSAVEQRGVECSVVEFIGVQ